MYMIEVHYDGPEAPPLRLTFGNFENARFVVRALLNDAGFMRTKTTSRNIEHGATEDL